jgi:hypothetical protein
MIPASQSSTRKITLLRVATRRDHDAHQHELPSAHHILVRVRILMQLEDGVQLLLGEDVLTAHFNILSLFDLAYALSRGCSSGSESGNRLSPD